MVHSFVVESLKRLILQSKLPSKFIPRKSYTFPALQLSGGVEEVQYTYLNIFRKVALLKKFFGTEDTKWS